MVIWVEPRKQPETKTQKNKDSRRIPGQFCFCLVFCLFFSFFGGKQHVSENNQNQKKQKNKAVPVFSVNLWFFGFGLGLAGPPDRRNQDSNWIPLKKHELAGGSGVFKGVVCRRRDDHLCIYIYIYIYMSPRPFGSI